MMTKSTPKTPMDSKHFSSDLLKAGWSWFVRQRNMDVSKNRGFSPKSSILNRIFHYFHHPFWGFPPILGNTHRLFDTQKIIPSGATLQAAFQLWKWWWCLLQSWKLFIASFQKGTKKCQQHFLTPHFSIWPSFQGQFWEVLKWKNFENVHRVKPSN